MATTVSIQPPPHRPSMDRTGSFDQARSRSTPPYTNGNSSRSSSPAVRPASYAAAAHGSHSAQSSMSYSHSRNSSTASASSPYAQPFPSSYFPQQQQQQQLYSLPHSQSWSTTALPSSAYYPQMMQQYNGQGYHPAYPQSQADFAAWANAYQQMVAASMAGGGGGEYGNGMGGAAGMHPPQPDFGGERRRTNSGPSQTQTQGYNTPPNQNSAYPSQQKPGQPPQPQSFHPYKRGGPANAGRGRSDTNASTNSASTGTLPRSTSTPAFPSNATHTPSSSVSSRGRPASLDHQRHSSVESSPSSVHAQRPVIAPRKESSQTDQRAKTSPVPSTKTTTSTIKAVNSSQQSQPLHTGPIANNATNTPHVPRSSPLAQSVGASPEPEKVKNGLKSRLKKALDKDAATKKAASPAKPLPKTNITSPSLNSSHSVTPPTTPPQANDFATPSAPFSNASAMDSEISLAQTERTATGAVSEMEGKSKRSLFRMRNMSTDNISLSSTVSSASMMIRKMGSIGKLARRNSLMGISKIFKDKPKDEDAALPEREAKLSKKEKKKQKKSKGDAAPVAVSRATAESDRLTVEEDRALAGLSPAAKLARQHTLRSKAEQAQKDAARLSQASSTGEPTWDNNTTTRTGGGVGVLPPISSITEEGLFDPNQISSDPPPGSNIVRIASRQGPTVVHAVAVSEQEYDSEDDSSDGETVDHDGDVDMSDVTARMGRSRLSDGSADREFREAWGNAWIDKNAVPKKGILKNILSSEDLEATASRQRSNSTVDSTLPTTRGPLSSPPADPDKMDGLDHAQPVEQLNTSSPQPMSPAESFSASITASFDPPTLEPNFPYQNPSHNTSAPTLSLLGNSKPLVPRALTAPTPVKRKILWAPECAVYSTYDAGTYDRRSEPATCNRLTPELAMAIKQELNTFKLEMPVHPSSRRYTHYFA